MKQIVDGGELGKVLWMRGRYGKEVDEDYFKGWRADPKLAGGGIMLDQGIHMLDLMRHLSLEEFTMINSFVTTAYWKIKVEEASEKRQRWLLNIPSLLLHNYKKFFWKKKKWN